MAMRKQERDPLAATRLWGELIGGPHDRLTGEELAHLPEDGLRYELLEGRLVRMPPPQDTHGRIVIILSGWLFNYWQQHGMAGELFSEVGYMISAPDQPDTVLAPDISYIAPGRAPEAKKGAYRRAAPDLAVEVVSPSQFHPEMAEKAGIYLAAGVKLVWLVWPLTQTIEVWRDDTTAPLATLGIDDTLDGLDVMPGFSQPVNLLFSTGFL